MPKRPRPRARPTTQRKKIHHRYAGLSPTSSEPGSAAAPRAIPFSARSTPATEPRIAQPRVHAYDYGYVLRELRRIAMIGSVMLVLVIVFSFLLR